MGKSHGKQRVFLIFPSALQEVVLGYVVDVERTIQREYVGVKNVSTVHGRKLQATLKTKREKRFRFFFFLNGV